LTTQLSHLLRWGTSCCRSSSWGNNGSGDWGTRTLESGKLEALELRLEISWELEATSGELEALKTLQRELGEGTASRESRQATSCREGTDLRESTELGESAELGISTESWEGTELRIGTKRGESTKSRESAESAKATVCAKPVEGEDGQERECWKSWECRESSKSWQSWSSSGNGKSWETCKRKSGECAGELEKTFAEVLVLLIATLNRRGGDCRSGNGPESKLLDLHFERMWLKDCRERVNWY
jgi:hypothetical protein